MKDWELTKTRHYLYHATVIIILYQYHSLLSVSLYNTRKMLSYYLIQNDDIFSYDRILKSYIIFLKSYLNFKIIYTLIKILFTGWTCAFLSTLCLLQWLGLNIGMIIFNLKPSGVITTLNTMYHIMKRVGTIYMQMIQQEKLIWWKIPNSTRFEIFFFSFKR